MGLYTKNPVLVACFCSLCTRQKRCLSDVRSCFSHSMFKLEGHPTAFHGSNTDKKQETELLLTEYPLSNFPRPLYSVGRKKVPARSHFRSTRTDDQSSQFLGTPLQTVGRVSRRLESNDMSVGKIRRRLVSPRTRQHGRQSLWAVYLSNQIHTANELKPDSNKTAWNVYSNTRVLLYILLCTNTN